jgi:hypothetical protein
MPDWRAPDEVHDWDGCKCRRCGVTGNHDWDGCVCRRCGEKRDMDHDWNRCKCRRCGCSGNHDLNDKCRCRKCWKECHDYYYWTEHITGTDNDGWPDEREYVHRKCSRCGEDKIVGD